VSSWEGPLILCIGYVLGVAVTLINLWVDFHWKD